MDRYGHHQIEGLIKMENGPWVRFESVKEDAEKLIALKNRVAELEEFLAAIHRCTISLNAATILLLVLLLALCLTGLAFAQTLTLFDRTSNTVTLHWTANTEPDLHHYTVYIHADSVRPAMTVAAPDTVAEFLVSPRYYYERIGFTVTATDQAGNESGHSNQIDAVFSSTPALLGDVTGDGRVDVEDVELVRASLGALPWYVGWREQADVDGSRKIDNEDVEVIRTKYGNR